MPAVNHIPNPWSPSPGPSSEGTRAYFRNVRCDRRSLRLSESSVQRRPRQAVAETGGRRAAIDGTRDGARLVHGNRGSGARGDGRSRPREACHRRRFFRRDAANRERENTQGGSGDPRTRGIDRSFAAMPRAFRLQTVSVDAVDDRLRHPQRRAARRWLAAKSCGFFDRAARW